MTGCDYDSCNGDYCVCQRKTDGTKHNLFDEVTRFEPVDHSTMEMNKRLYCIGVPGRCEADECCSQRCHQVQVTSLERADVSEYMASCHLRAGGVSIPKATENLALQPECHKGIAFSGSERFASFCAYN